MARAKAGAGDGDVKITIDADANKAIAEMRRLHAMTRQVGDQLHDLKNKAKPAETAVRGLADGLGDLHKANNVLGGSFSALTGPLDDFGDLIDRVGMGQAAMMAGVGALAASVVALGLNVVDVSANWREYETQLGRVSDVIVENRDEMYAASAAVEALSDAWAGLRVSIAGDTVRVVQGAGSLISDTIDKMRQSTMPAAQAFVWAADRISSFGDAEYEAAKLTQELARRETDLARAYDQTGIKLRTVADEQRDAAEIRRQHTEATARAGEAERQYAAALAEEDAMWQKIGASAGAASMAALESSRSADVATTMGSETVVTDTGASLDPTTGFQAVDPGVGSADQAAVDDTKKTAQEWAQHWQGAIDTAAGAFDMFAGIVVDVGSFIINKTEKDTIKAKKKQFALEKAAAITVATINTFKAVTQALGSMPPPASFVLAALAGAAGAVQIGLIAAQQPKFHRGGILPDEVQREGYVARRNETPAVMTAQAMRAMGGEEGLQRMQAGQAPEQPIYLVVDGEPRRSRRFAGPDPGFGIRPGWGR